MNATLMYVIIIAAALLSLAAIELPRRLNKSSRREYYKSEWLKISAMLHSPEGTSLAIIEADKLLDAALKEKRFSGETLGERLKSARGAIGDNDAVWSAHKLRNRLVHEATDPVTAKQAQHALNGFRSALKDLGAL